MTKNDYAVELALPGIRGAAIFYAAAFLISWTIWSSLIFFPQTADWAPLIILAGAYGPLLAAFLLSRTVGGPGAARSWLRSVSGVRGKWRWILFGGLILPLLIALTHLLLCRVFAGPIALSANPPWYWAASTAPINILVLFWMSSAVEEFGWQGFAMPRLTRQLHPLVACLIQGVVWATWHLPLYLTGAWSADYQAVWLLYGITLALTPTLFWLTRQAGGSVIPAVLLHAATNHYSALFVEEQAYPVFAEPLSVYFVETKIMIYLLCALLLILLTHGRLGMPRKAGTAAETQTGTAVQTCHPAGSKVSFP